MEVEHIQQETKIRIKFRKLVRNFFILKSIEQRSRVKVSQIKKELEALVTQVASLFKIDTVNL